MTLSYPPSPRSALALRFDDGHYNARAFAAVMPRALVWHWHGWKPYDIECWVDLMTRGEWPSGERLQEVAKAGDWGLKVAAEQGCRGKLAPRLLPHKCFLKSYALLLSHHRRLIRMAETLDLEHEAPAAGRAVGNASSGAAASAGAAAANGTAAAPPPPPPPREKVVIREGYSHTPTHKEIRAAQRRDAAHKGNESTAESKFFSFFDSKGKEKKGKAPPAAPRPPANASAPR